MRSRKGFERALMNDLIKQGHLVMRIAGSGVHSGANCDLILFPKNLHLPILVEVKTVGADKWEFKRQPQRTREELMKLKETVGKFGLRGCLAIRFLRRKWLFLDIQKLHENSVFSSDDRPDFKFF